MQHYYNNKMINIIQKFTILKTHPGPIFNQANKDALQNIKGNTQ